MDAQSAVGGGGGNGGGGDNDFVWGYTDKHYFFTTLAYNGNLGGLSGADTKCNTDANAISGKTYHAVRPNDSVYNAPGVGLYNDKYGWVNSVLRVVPLYNSNILFNKNYSGNGSQAIHASTVLPDILITAEDASIRYKTSAPSFWIVDGSISNTCNSWTTGSASSIYGGAGIFAVSNYVGHITNNAPLPCNLPQNLLCVEN